MGYAAASATLCPSMCLSAYSTASTTETVKPKETVGAADKVISSGMDADNYTLPHPIWPGEYIDNVKITHRPAENFTDRLAKFTINTMRFNFDLLTGYMFGSLTEEKFLTRMIFLETVAGVPGSVAATLRHLQSLRRMKRDHGWIHTLLEEAENERMHLITAITLKDPGPFMRSMVWIAQGVWFNFFFLSYLIHPRFCHRMVGYLEEEAVVTYTKAIKAIDDGTLGKWKTTPAPDVAIKYWRMDKDATFRDVLLVIRADEAHHRLVNHEFASLGEAEDNPFVPGGMHAHKLKEDEHERVVKTTESKKEKKGPPVYPGSVA